MGTWNSRGLRGSLLEELINRSNEVYRTQGLALVQKIPTPITPVEMSKNHRCITLAYFEKQSTVDYIGVVQGIPVCFDAKECASDTFPLANIHEHQLAFMRAFEQQRGISFLLISPKIFVRCIGYFIYLLREKVLELLTKDIKPIRLLTIGIIGLLPIHLSIGRGEDS